MAGWDGGHPARDGGPRPPWESGGWPAPGTLGSDSAEPKRSGGSGRRWVLIGLALLVATLGLVWWATSRGGGSDGPDIADGDGQGGATPPPTDGTAPSDPVAPGGGARFSPDSVAVGAGHVWVSDSTCGIVAKISPDGSVVSAIAVAGAGSGVTFVDDTVWVGDRAAGTVVGIDPDSLRRRHSVSLPGSPLGVGSGEGDVWAVDVSTGSVHRVDASSGALVASVPVGPDPHYVSIGPSGVWVTTVDSAVRIDPATDGVSLRVPLGGRPLHVAEHNGLVWVTLGEAGSVVALDGETGEVVGSFAVGPFAHAHVVAGGRVWVGTETGMLTDVPIDAQGSGNSRSVGFSSIDMAADDDLVWVADAGGGSVVAFDSGSGEVSLVVDLAEYGDCEQFRSEAQAPRPSPIV